MPPESPNFDRVARPYRWAEYLALGPLLQQTRTAHLDRLTYCRQALLSSMTSLAQDERTYAG